MEIRRGILAAAMLAGLLGLTGCAPEADTLGTMATASTTVDPFVVDVQVPYVTNRPMETEAPDGAEDDRYISINADGKVTILKDSWDEYKYDNVDQTGYFAQLRLGDSGVEVKNLQNRLKELGYYSGSDTGEFDEATEAALKQFEANYYEKCYGVATVKLQSLLFSQSAVPAAGVQATPGAMADGDAVQAPEELKQLNFGDVSAAVTSLQQRLAQLGYLHGGVTGEYDYYTSCAVMRFEAAYDRELTGIATKSMQEYLYREDAIALGDRHDQASNYGQFLPMKKGNKGADVLLLQQRLVDLGYSTNTPNGKFNSYTVELVQAFQRKGGLEATGQADAATQELLFGRSAPRGE